MFGSIEEQIIAYAIVFLLGMLSGYKIRKEEKEIEQRNSKNKK